MKKCALKLAAFFAMVFLLLPVCKMDAAAWNFNTDPTITVSGGRITVTWRSGGNYTEANVNVYLNGYSIGGTCVDYGMGNTYTFTPYDYYKKYQEGGEVVAKIEYLTYGADRVTKSYDTLTCSLPALKRLDGPEASMNCNGILDVTLGKDLNGINYTLYRCADGKSSVVKTDMIRDLQPGHYSYDLSAYMKDETNYRIELQGADYSYSAGWPYSQTLYIQYHASAKSGKEGNISWTFDPADDSLTIAGEGSIPKYFLNGGLCDYVNKVIIKDGITGIDKIAFVDYTEVTEIYIPSSVKTIDPDFIGYTGQAHSETIHIFYDGREDDWRALGGAASNYITGLTCIVALKIAEQPEDVTVEAGNIASFSIRATGDTLKYQWKKSTDGGKTWVNSSSTGATTNTLSMTAKANFNGYKFKCVVTDKNGKTVESTAATLTVKAGLAITAQPSNVTVAAGANATFKITATGTGLKYQWKKSTDGGKTWVNSSSTGCTTNTLSMTTKASFNGYKFKCVVTDKNGKTVTSNAATLTVTAAGTLAITTQPSNVTVASGATATFKIAATSTGLKYQWKKSTDGGKTWVNSSSTGCTTDTLSMTTKASYNGLQFKCVVTDANGKTVTSNAATLTVVAAGTLAITTQPSNVTVASGATATFKIAAVGTGLKYQWKKSTDGGKTWVNSSSTGAKTDTLSMVTKASYNGLQFKCVVTDANGKTVTSSVATLTIK